MFYWKTFRLLVHFPSKCTHMYGASSLCFCSHSLCVYLVYDTPTRASSTAHASDCKSVFRNSSTCHSQALSHTHTHTYTLTPVWGSLFLTLESNSWSQLCRPATTCSPSAQTECRESPMWSTQTKEKSVWIDTVSLPDVNVVFGNSAPPWFWI